MRASGFGALLRECGRPSIKVMRSADQFNPLDTALALLCSPWLTTLAQPEDDAQARGVPLMRRGGGTHGVNSPSASDGSDVSWGRMMEMLQGDVTLPAQANQQNHLWTQDFAGSSNRHAGKGKEAVEQSSSVHPQVNGGATSAPSVAGIAQSRTAEAFKGRVPWNKGLKTGPKRLYQSRVPIGPKRKPGGQPGFPAHNRGKMAPSFVKGPDGELRPRKRPGFKPGTGNPPWNKGKNAEMRQQYRLNKARERAQNGAAAASDLAVDNKNGVDGGQGSGPGAH